MRVQRHGGGWGRGQPSFENFTSLANGTFGYSPAGAALTVGSRSGLTLNGSAFNPPATPAGSAAAFVHQVLMPK